MLRKLIQLLATALAVASLSLFVTAQATAQSSAVAPLLKLLESGRVPKERQGQIVEMICTRGAAEDLAVIFQQFQKADAFSPALRLKVIELLTDAAVTRKVKPAGDLSGLAKLIVGEGASADPALQLAALRLASHWKLPAIAGSLRDLATKEGTSEELRRAAIEGLVSLGDDASRKTLADLASAPKTNQTRILATAGLAKFDVDAASKTAAGVLAACTAEDDPSPLVDAMLSRQGGAEKLAAALAGAKLAPDVAKIALRHMYSVGRSDQELSDVLSKAAGIAADAPPPSQAEVQKLVAEVTAKGDASSGEKIFRRADLSCLKCHAIAQAGGNVGPELSAVGSISPIDYVVNSILNPNLAIKEQFVTRKVLTVDGQVFTGIQIDRDDQRLRLRDAAGKVITVPVNEIDREAEGTSLMPQGLTKFLTHDEFLDLAKFISELGKPGPYAIRKTPSIQRWRVLASPGKELTEQVPNVETIRVAVLDARPEAWTTAYGTVGGFLPLAEVVRQRPAVVYLQGELNVVEGGPIGVQITSTEPAQAWLDAEPFEKQTHFERSLAPGKHTLTLRVEVSDKVDPRVKVEFTRPEGSAAQFTVVGGM